MKKSTKKVLSAVMAAFVAAASIPFGSVGAFTYDPLSASDINGDTTNPITFKKYLVMDETAEVPNTSFSFTLKTGTAVPVSDGKMEVKITGTSGASAGTVDTAAFVTNQTTYTAADIETQNDNIELEANQKYAKDPSVEVTLNTGLQFTEPGVYRFEIQENDVTATGITAVTSPANTPVYLDVYINDVVSGGSHALEYAGYKIHTNAEAPSVNASQGTDTNGYTEGTKIDGLVNNYSAKNLRVGKAVGGNQGSRDKYFKVTVNVTGLNAGDTFAVSLAADQDEHTVDGKAEGTPTATDATKYTSMSNPTSITVDAGQTSFTQDFYLQNGQYVAIRGLPAGASYSVTEDAEDYTQAKGPTIDSIPFTNGELSEGAITGTLDADQNVGFTNTKNGTVPTGILLTYTPIVVIGIFAVAGIIFLSMRRRKAE